jgi:ketosteroid isomerase-like protein
MNLLIASLCLAVWNPAASASTINVDWSAATGTDAPIAAIRREYVSRFNAQIGALQTMYTADALAILADGAPADSLGEAARQTSSADSPTRVTVTLVPRRFVVSGDTGSEAGTFVEQSSASEGSTVEGMYVTIYARGADGRWRIAMEVRTRGGHAPLALW